MGARDPSPTSLDLSPRIQSQTKDFPPAHWGNPGLFV